MCPQKILPQLMKQVILDDLLVDTIELAKSRLTAIFMVSQMANDLDEEEKVLKSPVEPGMREVGKSC